MDKACFIEGKRFEGYIFDKEHFALISIENQKTRYTPSKEEIYQAEEILSAQVEELNKSEGLVNQVDNCPVIHKKLKKYKRQYMGFINDKGQVVIWINFVWNKDLEDRLSENIIQVQDGCSYYWNIKVNLDTEELYALSVNGVG